MKNGDKPWQGNGYSVSSFNFSPEVTQAYHFWEPMEIQEGTIVKMDHLACSRLYPPEEYIQVCRLLEEAGLRNTYFHTGLYPGTPKNESIWQGLRAVARTGSKLQLRVSARFFSWKLGEYGDRVDQIVDSGANGVHIAPNGDVEKLEVTIP